MEIVNKIQSLENIDALCEAIDDSEFSVFEKKNLNKIARSIYDKSYNKEITETINGRFNSIFESMDESEDTSVFDDMVLMLNMTNSFDHEVLKNIIAKHKDNFDAMADEISKEFMRDRDEVIHILTNVGSNIPDINIEELSDAMDISDMVSGWKADFPYFVENANYDGINGDIDIPQGRYHVVDSSGEYCIIADATNYYRFYVVRCSDIGVRPDYSDNVEHIIDELSTYVRDDELMWKIPDRDSLNAFNIYSYNHIPKGFYVVKNSFTMPILSQDCTNKGSVLKSNGNGKFSYFDLNRKEWITVDMNFNSFSASDIRQVFVNSVMPMSGVTAKEYLDKIS